MPDPDLVPYNARRMLPPVQHASVVLNELRLLRPVRPWTAVLPLVRPQRVGSAFPPRSEESGTQSATDGVWGMRLNTRPMVGRHMSIISLTGIDQPLTEGERMKSAQAEERKKQKEEEVR